MLLKKISLLIISLVWVGSVFSADLTNNDDVSYTIKVETDTETTTIIIGAGEVIKDICNECVIFMDGSEEPFDVYEGDVVFIADGLFATSDS